MGYQAQGNLKMNEMKKYWILFVLSLLPLFSYGQVLHAPNMNMDEWFRTDVTTMSEFRDRFNICINDTDSLTKEQRMRGLLTLFNRSSETVYTKQDTIRSFINSVLDNKINLSFSDSLWFAEALCVTKYKGKEHDIRLILKTEFVDTDIYRWSICGVNGLRDAGVITDKAFGFIEPIDNDLNFIGMDSRLQKDYKNAFGYKSSNSAISQLSVFLYLLQEHQITIEYVNSIKYHFLSIPGYVFVVEHSTKPMNSGWLISDISLLSDEGRELYEKALFGNY